MLLAEYVEIVAKGVLAVVVVVVVVVVFVGVLRGMHNCT